MIHCRPFLNTDPPLLVRLWQRQKQLRGMAQGITVRTLEDLVFSLPWFDARGLWLGFRDGELCGLMHAGFAATPGGTDLDFASGVISQVRVASPDHDVDIAAELVRHGLAYVASLGARQCYGGSHFPWSPFYLGIYGGSRVPGVLSEDQSMLKALLAEGFQPAGEIGIFHRLLAGYRPLVDRRLMALRRQFDFVADVDPHPKSWWEACSLGSTYRIRFSLVDKSSHEPVAWVTFWDMQPISGTWGARAMGLFDLTVADHLRRTGMATCLINEALRALAQEGVGLVEAQFTLTDSRATGCFSKLGFHQVDMGIQLRRELPA